MHTNTATRLFSALTLTLLSTVASQAQLASRSDAASTTIVNQKTTFPVVFNRTISAKNAHPGDTVIAHTTAPVRLSNEDIIPAGSIVRGHVVSAQGYQFNPVPYAPQQASTLTVVFDSVSFRGTALPLQATIRALAVPQVGWAAAESLPTDLDPSRSTTQVGGDVITPSESAIVDAQGRTVGYVHHGYAYAHLVGAAGCDASTSEQATGIFSASACGLYGMPDDRLSIDNSNPVPSIRLSASGHAAQIHANSQALLEQVTGVESASAK